MKPLFSRKIRCLKCGKNFKGKMQRGSRVYVCSSYDNYGKCERNLLREDFLIDLVQNRYNDDLNLKEVGEAVERIEVKGRNIFNIQLIEDKPIKFEENFIQF